MVESVGEAGEGAFGAERPDVDLVEDETLGGQTAPVAIGPGIVEGADDLAGPVDVVRLEAGGGIGHEQVAVDPERVAGARRRVARHPLRPSGGIARHGESLFAVGEPELDTACRGRPQAEARGAVVPRLGPEWHPMRAPQRDLRAHVRAPGRRSRRTARERASRG